MKKIFQFILISVVAIGSFLSPISNARAQTSATLVSAINEASAGSIKDTSASFNVTITNTKTGYSGGLSGRVYSNDPLKTGAGAPVAAAADVLLKDNTATQTVTVAFPSKLSAGTVYYADFQLAKRATTGFGTQIVTEGVIQFKTASSATASDGQLISNSYQNNTLSVGGGGAGVEPVVTNTTTTPNPEDLLPVCGISFGFGSGSIYGCIINIFYYAFWMPTSWLAGLAGKLLDFFIFYSIDSSSYHSSGFVNEGWKVIRDIANIAFIFVLLYIALRTILNLGGSQNKKMITWVVIIALLINFSLFFTKVIIDSGNILANVLYNDIGARAQKNGQVVGTTDGEFREKGISASLVNQFDPQKIVQNAGIKKENVNDIKTPYLVIIILATIVNIFMITTFLSIMFLFVGRVVGLMFSMIFSPFAFMSLTIPGSGKILRQWSWDQWLSELLNLTFMAPIFIFFLWLILLFLGAKGGLLGDLFAGTNKSIGFGDGSGQILSNFIAVIAPFILILGLLSKAKEVTKSMAGEVATKISGLAGGAVGFLGGAALGGAAFLGRATVGRLASSVASGGGAGGAAAAEGTVARPPIVPLAPHSGVLTPTERLILSRGQKGGFAQQQARQEERDKEFATAGTFVKPEIKGSPESGIRTPEEIRTENAREQAVEEETKKGLTGLNLTSNLSIADAQKAAATKAAAETAKKTAAVGAEKKSAEAEKSKVEKVAEEEKKIGAEKGDIKTATDEVKKEAVKKKVATEAEIATKEAELKAEEGKFAAKSFKDMAAAAPKSIFSLIKSKQKGTDIKNMLGKQAFDLAKYLGQASFDIRDTKMGKFIAKETGFDLGKAGGKGGFDGMQKKIIENELKYAEALETSGREKENLNRLESKHIDLQNKQKLAGGQGKDSALDALVERAKTDFEAEKTKLKNIDVARRTERAKAIEKGGILSYSPTNAEAAKKIRSGAKAKSDSDKAVDLLKKIMKEEGKKEGGEEKEKAPKPEKKEEKPKEGSGEEKK